LKVDLSSANVMIMLSVQDRPAALNTEQKISLLLWKTHNTQPKLYPVIATLHM